MAHRPNRRDLIIQTAAALFIKQGYTATSVRQIADTVGCSEAALYYHFENGKRSLLQAVVESEAPDFVNILDECRHASTLSQLIVSFINSMCAHCQEKERHIQWLISEFPKLRPDEKAIFHEKHLAFHAALVDLLLPFVKDENQADDLGWMLLCISFGYRQMFITLGLSNLVDFPVDRLAKKMDQYLVEHP